MEWYDVLVLVVLVILVIGFLLTVSVGGAYFRRRLFGYRCPKCGRRGLRYAEIGVMFHPERGVVAMRWWCDGCHASWETPVVCSPGGASDGSQG